MEQAYIVTGANAGIGKSIAHGLAARGLNVLMLCRDPQKGAHARDEIRAVTGNQSVELVVGDLSSSASVRAAAQELLERVAGIAALIHNAGIWQTRLERNQEGVEATFAVNHLAPFLLTHLLLERLESSAPSRVVNVNARLYVFGRVDPQRTPSGEDFSRFRTYANSKLCNVLFTRELARRLDGGVTVNAVHPGVIRTNLGGGPGPLGAIMRLSKWWMKPPAHGARGPIYLATAGEVSAVSGCFFDELKRVEYAPVAIDDELSAHLWRLSESLTGLSQPLTHAR